MFNKVTSRFLKRLVVVIVAAGLIIPVVVVSTKYLAVLGSQQAAYAFKPQSVSLTINTIFSDQLHAAIQKFVQEHCGHDTVFTFDYDAFYSELKERFPIVYDMDFDFGSNKELKLTINGTTPLCRVNEALVLGNQTNLFDRELFETVNTQNLPNITINTQWCGDTLDAHVYDFVHSIPAHYWHQYAITYHAPHHIVLQPQQSVVRCAIIVDEKTCFEKRKFASLSSLFERLCQRGDITKKMLQSKNIPLVFDFRLKNQIIVKYMHAGKRGKGL